MLRTLAAALASASLSLAACAGHSLAGTGSEDADAGQTTVQGSIGGVSFPVAYALAIPDNSQAATGPASAYTKLALGIADKPLTCATPGLPNSTLIGISIKAIGPSPVGIGSYSINVDQTSSFDNLADLVTTDATCNETSPSDCIGGTVTITSVTATSFSGTFTLAFDSGEALHGTFSADVCATIPPSLSGAGC